MKVPHPVQHQHYSHMGLYPMASHPDTPTGKLRHDPSRTKEYLQDPEGIFWKTAILKCPCLDEDGKAFDGIIKKSYLIEDDNSLSCPTQTMVRPHYTELGKRPYTKYRSVNPSEFDEVNPTDSTQ